MRWDAIRELLHRVRSGVRGVVRRPAFLPLLALACVYALAFVPQNLSGARDPNMLAAFQLDEYVQFGVLNRMLTPKPSPVDSLIDFVVYRHYFYGYPYYLASALFVAPLWVATGFASPAEHTQVYMLALRMMSLVGVAVSLFLMLWMWDGLRSRVRALGFFLFFCLAPAVVFNNTWWHPDGLLTILVTLTIFALYSDNLRFGRWFIAAAVGCGLAAGTKLVGLFFFLTIAVYLLIGLGQGRLTWRQLMLKGALFVGVMALTVVVVNPLLLVPRTSSQIVGTLFKQATSESQRGSTRGPLAWYDEQMRGGFGYWWVYLGGLAACVLGIVSGSGRRRLLNVIILTWVLPFSLYCLTVVTFKKSYYFIPILLPLLSCVVNPDLWRPGIPRRAGAGFAAAVVALYITNLPLYLGKDVGIVRYNLVREAENESLAFFRALEAEYLSALPPESDLTIFRDPYIYVPPEQVFDIHMKWGAATYADIAEADPDLILLQRSNIERYAQADAPTAEPEALGSSGRFYDDARRSSLAGYSQLLETEFGVAFVRSTAGGAGQARP